jgi:hypothetical protein
MDEPDNEVDELIMRVLYDCHTTLSHEDINVEVNCVLSVLYHAIVKVAASAALKGVFEPLKGDPDSAEPDEFLNEWRNQREAELHKKS